MFVVYKGNDNLQRVHETNKVLTTVLGKLFISIFILAHNVVSIKGMNIRSKGNLWCIKSEHHVRLIFVCSSYL